MQRHKKHDKTGQSNKLSQKKENLNLNSVYSVQCTAQTTHSVCVYTTGSYFQLCQFSVSLCPNLINLMLEKHLRKHFVIV